MNNSLRIVVIGMLSAFLLCSCASERVKEQARKEKANKDQYVDYYPVGSNIPIKIPKDDPRAKASTAETEEAQRIFHDVQQAGVITPGDPETQASHGGGATR